MNFRTKLTRAFAPASAAQPERTTVARRANVVSCTQCSETAERLPSGNLPHGWFPFISGELLCPNCLKPVLDDVGESWRKSNEQFLRDHPNP